MAYPKPLSRKTLEKKYQFFEQETREFLRRFFTAASNLYGVVSLEDLFAVYVQLMKKRKEAGLNDKEYVKKIIWEKFVVFSEILRRDGDVSFYVYNVREVYEDEFEAEELGTRLVINKDEVTRGQYKFDDVYDRVEEQEGKEYFVPVNFLDYERHIATPAEKKLLKFLENLKSTASKLPKFYFMDEKNPDTYVWNKNKGSYLKNICTILFKDEFMIEKLGGADKINYADRIRIFNEDGKCRNLAEQMLGFIHYCEQEPWFSMADIVGRYQHEFVHMGVNLNNKQVEEFVFLLVEFHNTLSSRSNRGFTPSELYQINSRKNPNMVPKINFGEGYKKMIEEGNFSIEELRQKVFDDENLSLPLKKSILDGLNDLEKKM